MKTRIFWLVALLGVVLTTQASVVTYTADNTTVFKNPERGFTEELSRKVSESKPNVVKGQLSSNWGKNYKMTVPVVLYNLGNYKAEDIPDVVLNGFDEDMAELRTYGLKCVLRFAYSERESDKEDATPEWVKRHLEQLKPHLAANQDVIYVLEAGFVGVWGEWYYTNNYGNESQHMNENRRKVIDYLFENTPNDMFILFRYPMIQTEYLNDTEPLTAEEGFSGSVKSRMGCHNDAFMNAYGDMGTYASDNRSDDPAVRQYVATSTLYVPNGGETNIEENALAEQRYADAPEEMSTYHWSFCGSSYAVPVTSRWRTSGIFDTLNVHMGYRYNLLSAQFSDEAAPSGKMNVTIQIRNAGYAPMYNARSVYLVLVDSQKLKVERIKLTADPRRWLPNGEISAINEQVEIPAELLDGTYELYLWMPDRFESIAADPRYAVRFGNEEVWEEETGYNDLKATVTISKSAPMDPGPLPEGIETVEGQESKVERPTKILENGILYILMPNGKKYYCF